MIASCSTDCGSGGRKPRRVGPCVPRPEAPLLSCCKRRTTRSRRTLRLSGSTMPSIRQHAATDSPDARYGPRVSSSVADGDAVNHTSAASQPPYVPGNEQHGRVRCQSTKEFERTVSQLAETLPRPADHLVQEVRQGRPVLGQRENCPRRPLRGINVRISRDRSEQQPSHYRYCRSSAETGNWKVPRVLHCGISTSCPHSACSVRKLVSYETELPTAVRRREGTNPWTIRGRRPISSLRIGL
jgi:hypothetical protein